MLKDCRRVLEKVVKNDQAKFLWDFNEYIDNQMVANPLDIVVMNKTAIMTIIIHAAIPSDFSIEVNDI